MASASTPSSFSPPSAAARLRSSKPRNPSRRTLHYLSNQPSISLFKLSRSFPFPFPFPSSLNLKPPPSPTHLHPPRDTVHDGYLEVLHKPPAADFLAPPVEQVADQDTRPRIFIQDPPWIYPIFFKNVYRKARREAELELKEMDRRRYNSLRRRQIRAETEAWEKMVEEYRELEREMRDRKLAPNLPRVKALFLGWFDPLKEAIRREQRMQRTKKNKAAYAPHIDLLPAEKMAVIVMHKMMGLVMVGNTDGCVELVQAAVHVGVAIEQEVMVQSLLEKSKSNRKKMNLVEPEVDLDKDQVMRQRRVNGLIKRKRFNEVRKLVKEEEFEPWGRDTQAKLGTRLIELLTETAFVQPPVKQLVEGPPDVRPAFRHKLKMVKKDPGKKILKRYGVIECDPLILEKLDINAKHMLAPYMPMLVPPRKWKGYDKGGYFFLPSYAMRTHGSRKQQDALKNVSEEQMHNVFKALDTLGSTKWRINRRVLAVVESLWAQGGSVGGLVERHDLPLPVKDVSNDGEELELWKWNVRKAKKVNRERHAQRCDVELKLSVARKMKEEEGFYYPHNLDFRGRAYPMHSHLNHLSSDLCRGVLEFAEGRPLGKSGFHWLKIHLANLYSGGVEKLSHDGRLAFIENHMDDIFDSAEKPIEGNRWWLTAEDPFQCLAACINLSEALKSLSPYTAISHLPIHQDGSCNGLQHYAALGRDSVGTFSLQKAVTLTALEEIFEAARGIMGWLGDCAKIIASENQPVRWTTPLGLPVVQPYYKNKRHLIRTTLQILALQREGDLVDVRRQRTAFPPNFVHSLDGSHMMMTAVACSEAGLRFAGVHDSFWTHACDVDQMNWILREKFVELYDMPVLENLLESFQTSYPALTFPSLPDRGNFDLREVLKSPYFFN
ncbi:hypothetical protein NL676_034393 [Syzygium grande]|nr:hypothetical protein NL676_034393 [Syzygium grande]